MDRRTFLKSASAVGLATPLGGAARLASLRERAQQQESPVPSGRVLIQGGMVLTLDAELGHLPVGDVLLEDGQITAVGPNLQELGANVVDARGYLVMPGFVDAHRHMWQGVLRQIAPDTDLSGYFGGVLGTLAPIYTPDDVYIGNLLGALEALDAGVTTVFDWSHIQNTPAHTDEAVRALRESGLRTVFGYGFPNTGPEWFYESERPLVDAEVRRVRAQHFASQDGLVSMAMALRGPELSTFEVTQHDWALARDLGLGISVHIGNGAFGLPYRAVEQLSAARLMGPDVQYVHTTSLSDPDLQRIADTGGAAVVTLAVEAQMQFGVPATARLLKVGVRPGLGTDVITTTSGDMFGQMRAALQAARREAMGRDVPLLSTRDVLSFATLNAAHSIGLGDRTGSLTPGKQADVILLRTSTPGLAPVSDPVGSVVLGASVRDVDSVFVAGRAVKWRGRLVGVDLDRVSALALESRDRLLERSGFRPT